MNNKTNTQQTNSLSYVVSVSSNHKYRKMMYNSLIFHFTTGNYCPSYHHSSSFHLLSFFSVSHANDAVLDEVEC